MSLWDSWEDEAFLLECNILVDVAQASSESRESETSSLRVKWGEEWCDESESRIVIFWTLASNHPPMSGCRASRKSPTEYNSSQDTSVSSSMISETKVPFIVFLASQFLCHVIMILLLLREFTAFYTLLRDIHETSRCQRLTRKEWEALVPSFAFHATEGTRRKGYCLTSTKSIRPVKKQGHGKQNRKSRRDFRELRKKRRKRRRTRYQKSCPFLLFGRRL